MRARGMGLLALGLLVMAPAGEALAVRRPAPLVAPEGCELWVGTVSGNDPSVKVELVLCPEGNAVRGTLQWSSTLSGSNVRDVQGSWDASRRSLTLRDLRVRDQHPEPGWRFCVVDDYRLTRTPGGALHGTYFSSACRDRARVRLQRRR